MVSSEGCQVRLPGSLVRAGTIEDGQAVWPGSLVRAGTLLGGQAGWPESLAEDVEGIRGTNGWQLCGWQNSAVWVATGQVVQCWCWWINRFA